MTCELCGNKPMNCDCTQEARELYALRNEIAEQGNREYDDRRWKLAGMAMQGLIAAPFNECNPGRTSRRAVEYADALIAELEKEKK